MNAFRQLLQPPMLVLANPSHVLHQRVPLGIWISSASPLVA